MSIISKKICVIGDFGVGKTSLISRFVEHRFSEQYLSTIGVTISRKPVMVSSTNNKTDKQTVQLLIWDIEGKTRFHNISSIHLKSAQGIIVVADFSRQETIENIPSHLNLVRSVNPQGINLSIVFNKIDLLDQHLSKTSLEKSQIRIDGLTTKITEHKKIQEQLRHNALHDSLTGLPNRTLLMDRIEQAIRRCQRSENIKNFAVLFLDLDRFKVINDSLGHLMGDQILITISDRLAKCIRVGDTLARLGGDEFVILLENLTSVDDAISITVRIHRALKSPILLQNQEIFITVSIGVVWGDKQRFHHKSHQVSDLLRDADTAMYRAKAKGQGKSEVFNSSMHTYALKRLQIANNLQRAIERQEFIVYYQPIISFSGGHIHGFEALVRWQHPEKGLLSPADFIPIAEETEAILKIDEWVLRSACAQLSVWQAQFQGLAPLTISVNLSSKHLSKTGLIEILDGVLAQTGLEGKALKLEITESSLIENKETAMGILEQVKQRNIQLCLDDFGIGYSSLSYLDCFPFNVLKIDRSFIKRLVAEQDQNEIIKAIINLGLTLGMNVVAEGVETQVQMKKLKALNCCYGQGYGLFPPLKSEIITTLLQKPLFSYLLTKHHNNK